MAAAEHAQTPGEYIIHHLTHFGTGKPKGLVDFSVVNFDSVIFSIVLGALGCWLLWKAARIVPGVVWPVLLAAMVLCMLSYWFALLWRGPGAAIETTKR